MPWQETCFVRKVLRTVQSKYLGRNYCLADMLRLNLNLSVVTHTTFEQQLESVSNFIKLIHYRTQKHSMTVSNQNTYLCQQSRQSCDFYDDGDTTSLGRFTLLALIHVLHVPSLILLHIACPPLPPPFTSPSELSHTAVSCYKPWIIQTESSVLRVHRWCTVPSPPSDHRP